MNIFFIILLSAIDALLYGYFHQKKNGLKWLFWGINKFWFWNFKHTVYPLYRTLQGLMDIACLYYLYQFTGIGNMIGFVLAWFFMTKEYFYYIFLWQFKELNDFQNYKQIYTAYYENTDTYWLKRFYFAGKYLFAENTVTFIPDEHPSIYVTDYGFRLKIFTSCFVFGVVILIISNFI